MIARIDHVSLAVRDRDKAAAFFCNVLGAIPCSSSMDKGMKYLWQIYAIGDLSRLEVVSATGKGSFLERFLADGEGVHHITLQTTDIGKVQQTLEDHGIPSFGYYEYPGGEWKELFIHPRDAFGVLIQIAEFRAEDLIPDSLRLPGDMKWKVEKQGEMVRLELAHPGGGTLRVSLTRDEAARLSQDLKRAL